MELSILIFTLALGPVQDCCQEKDRLQERIIQRDAELSVMIELHSVESTQKIINAVFGGIGSLITLLAGIFTGKKIGNRIKTLPRPDT